MNSARNSDDRWTRTRDGVCVYRDTDEHVALIVRTLGIDEVAWSGTLDRYAALVPPGASVDERLSALAEAFRSASPHAAPLPRDVRTGGDDALASRSAALASSCAACSAPEMRPKVARRAGDHAPVLVFGACARCGHGQLLSGGVPDTIYESDAYYRENRADGVGYHAYEREQSYRQAKGARLLDWIESAAQVASARAGLPPVTRISSPRRTEPPRTGLTPSTGLTPRTELTPSTEPTSFLEIGSGFGFTLGAAAARGWRALGVDVNPAAAEAARRLYGLATVTATLGEALEKGWVPRGAWDLVLYQFVLEHLAHPEVELRHAAEALAPGGLLGLVVPNMATFEIDVFGASYRSLRADHRHLFSPASARAYLGAAGLTAVALQTVCSLHLVRGFLAVPECAQLYAEDRGPDLVVLAARSS